MEKDDTIFQLLEVVFEKPGRFVCFRKSEN